MNYQNNKAKVFRIIQAQSINTKSQKFRKIKNLKLALIFLVVGFLLAKSFFAFGIDTTPADGIDDAIVASIAGPGVQFQALPTNQYTSSAAVVTFNNTGTVSYTSSSFAVGSTITALNLSTNSPTTIGTVASTSGGLSVNNFNIFGGANANGQYGQPSSSTEANAFRINFTSVQKYIGFWWSAGNSDNNLQLLDANGNNILNPRFTTASVVTVALDGNSCPGTRPTEAELTSAPWKRYCGNPNYANQYVNEPYAFVHIRYDQGFKGIKLWGTGFEFDNLTISETVPVFGDDEEVVGDLPVLTNLPTVILVDPRAASVQFPRLTITNSNNAFVCISQVANSLGTAISGSPNILIRRETNISGVTETINTNSWKYNGTRVNLSNQIPELKIENSTTNEAVVPSGSKFISVRFRSTTDPCTNAADVSRVIEIRSLQIEQSLRKGTINLGRN